MARHNRLRRDGLDLRLPSHLIGLPEGIHRAYAAAGAAIVPSPDDVGFWNALPAALDPSQAPDGSDVVYIWTTQVPLVPETGWEASKDDFTKGILGRLSGYYSGLTELEIGRLVTTSEDLAAWSHATDGALAHVDWALHRFGPVRPARGLGGYHTPVKGLFLGGSGSHPGGGVTGGPGYLAAKEVIRCCRRRSGRCT
jgi:phytoene dehydrogenase-like protein